MRRCGDTTIPSEGDSLPFVDPLIRRVAPQIQPRPERRDLDGAESVHDKVRPGAVVCGEAGGERRVSGSERDWANDGFFRGRCVAPPI
jgi:hypothetical protein